MEQMPILGPGLYLRCLTVELLQRQEAEFFYLLGVEMEPPRGRKRCNDRDNGGVRARHVERCCASEKFNVFGSDSDFLGGFPYGAVFGSFSLVEHSAREAPFAVMVWQAVAPECQQTRWEGSIRQERNQDSSWTAAKGRRQRAPVSGRLRQEHAVGSMSRQRFLQPAAEKGNPRTCVHHCAMRRCGKRRSTESLW